MNKPNKPYELEVFAARNRNRVYETVVKALELAHQDHGLTRKGIAEATGKSPSQITTTLSGPSNWTLDTVSDLLRSAKAEMQYTVVFDREQTKPNYFNPASACVVAAVPTAITETLSIGYTTTSTAVAGGTFPALRVASATGHAVTTDSELTAQKILLGAE